MPITIVLEILVPVGEGRSKGYSILHEAERCSGALDITMFSLLIHDGIGLPPGSMLKM